jgi:hypothetical protein
MKQKHRRRKKIDEIIALTVLTCFLTTRKNARDKHNSCNRQAAIHDHRSIHGEANSCNRKVAI